MQTVVILTPEEFKSLSERQQEPSAILTQTVETLKSKNYKLIEDLKIANDELATYQLGGAKPKQPKQSITNEMLEVIFTYNAANTKAVKEAISFTFETLNRIHTTRYKSELEIKQDLKKWVSDGFFIKTRNNTYSLTPKGE